MTLVEVLYAILLHLRFWWSFVYYASVSPNLITLLSDVPLFVRLWLRICLIYLCTPNFGYESVRRSPARLILVTNLSGIPSYVWLWLRSVRYTSIHLALIMNLFDMTSEYDFVCCISVLPNLNTFCPVCFCMFDSDGKSVWHISVCLPLITDLPGLLPYVWLWLRTYPIKFSTSDSDDGFVRYAPVRLVLITNLLKITSDYASVCRTFVLLIPDLTPSDIRPIFWFW